MRFAGFLLAMSALPGPVSAIWSAVPVQGAPVVALVAPWADRQAMLAAADARQIGIRAAPFALLAAGDGDVAGRLRAAGAWMVMNGRAVAQLCRDQ